jgi:hypothetical protein
MLFRIPADKQHLLGRSPPKNDAHRREDYVEPRAGLEFRLGDWVSFSVVDIRHGRSSIGVPSGTNYYYCST